MGRNHIDSGSGWLVRALVIAVASACMTGCGGGGGNSTAAAEGAPDGLSAPGITQPNTDPAPNSDSDTDQGTGQDTGQDTLTASNHAPTLSGSPATSVVIDTPYSFQFAADDADGDPLTLAVQNLPSWAQLDADSQRVSGTPSASDAGTYSNILISVSDGSSTVTLPAFSVQVVPTALGQVTVSWQAPTTNTDGSALTDLVGYKIYFGNRSDNLDRSVRVDNAGLSSYVISNLTPATYFFSITALNRSGVESARSAMVNKTL